MVIFSTYTALLGEAPKKPQKEQFIPHVFCDVDGVVANFSAGIEQYFDVRFVQINKFLVQQDGWNIIKKKQPHLFDKLQLLPDARFLMNGLTTLRDYNRIRLSMLTAIPDEWYYDRLMRRMSSQDKVNWITRHFQRVPADAVLVVRRIDKASYARAQLAIGHPRPILIDDFGKNIHEWESAGGIGIKHKNATDSLRHLITMLPNN
jgi:5'(3')-deoxyribonucleotidase